MKNIWSLNYNFVNSEKSEIVRYFIKLSEDYMELKMFLLVLE